MQSFCVSASGGFKTQDRKKKKGRIALNLYCPFEREKGHFLKYVNKLTATEVSVYLMTLIRLHELYNADWMNDL